MMTWKDAVVGAIIIGLALAAIVVWAWIIMGGY
jgi:hypothetical protein